MKRLFNILPLLCLAMIAKAQPKPIAEKNHLTADQASLFAPDSSLYAKIDSVRKYYAYPIGYPVVVNPFSSLDYYGDSYMVGNNATITARRGINIYRYRIGFSTAFVNASGGTGIIFANYRTTINSPTINNNRTTLFMTGFTDIGHLGYTPKLFTMLNNGYKAFIANKFLATAVPASDASITLAGGTWSNYAGQDSSALKAGSLTGNAKQTFASGATATYSFSGNNIVIGTNATDAAYMTTDNFTVTIDGNFMWSGTFNDQTKYFPQTNVGVPVNTFLNWYSMPAVLYFDNLGTGAHTLVITKGTDTSKRLLLDYLGTLRTPQSSQGSPLIIGEIAYQTDSCRAIYKTLYNPAPYTNKTIDSANLVIRNVIKQFGSYPIAYSRTNSFYDYNTEFDPIDPVHPNNLGQQHLADAFSAASIPTIKALTASGVGQGNYKRSDSLLAVGSQIAGTTGSARIFTILKPKGGLYNNATATATGAIKITLPTNAATMTTIRGTIYNHVNGLSTPFFISFYGSTLTNGVAAQFSGATGYTVRLYVNGTTPTIYIGELTSTWSFLKVSVDELLIGHTGASDLTYSTGWTVGLEPTAFTGTLASTLTAAQTVPVYATSPTLITPKLTGYTVATLPTGAIGMIAYVTDATAPTFGGTLTGGGTVKIPVFYNGTAWVAY